MMIERKLATLVGVASRVIGFGPRWRQVRARGLEFRLPCTNWITRYRCQTYNSKEPETLDWIDRWVRDGETFFDVGANIGLYTIYAALRHPGARIVAFEPEYANLHLLKDSIMENGLGDRVEVYSLALSNRSGISFLHIQDLTPGSALHTESPEPLTVTRTQRPVIWREGVCAITLDEFCEQTGRQPHCMKIDVDGTELAVLEGGTRTIGSEMFRSLMVEMPEEAQAREGCLQWLLKAGLRCAWRPSSGSCANELWVVGSADGGAPRDAQIDGTVSAVPPR